MRLDLFLKASRICSGRSVAQELCDAGQVALNGRPAKSAHSVKVGDEIGVRMRNRSLVVRVEIIPAGRNTAKKEAASLYTVLEETTLPGERAGLE